MALAVTAISDLEIVVVALDATVVVLETVIVTLAGTAVGVLVGTAVDGLGRNALHDCCIHEIHAPPFNCFRHRDILDHSRISANDQRFEYDCRFPSPRSPRKPLDLINILFQIC